MSLPDVTHIYPAYHRRGGVERFLWEMTRRQMHHRNVRMLTADAEAPDEKSIEISLLRIPIGLSALRVLVFALRAAAQLSRWRRTSRTPFISHTQGASSLGSDVITAQSCHKAWFRSSLGELSPLQIAFWRKLFNPVHYVTILIETIQYKPGRFQKIAAVGGCVKRELQEQYGIPPEKIEVIYNGVDTDEFKPAPTDDQRVVLRKKNCAAWGCPESSTILLFAANEFRRKGLWTILVAMAKLREVPFHLVVAGRDSQLPFLSMISKMGLDGRVTFLGPVRDMANFYRAGDIFVFPTRYEPFGMVVLEAMSSGLPSITSRLAGVAETMHHGSDGILLDKPDSPDEVAAALSSLLPIETRKRMAEAARTTALRLSWDNISASYDRLYANLVLGNSRFRN